LTAKFKHLRAALKVWKTSLSNLKVAIDNVKLVLAFLQFIEEFRDLTIPSGISKAFLNLSFRIS
jgi:hypothetical protein